MSKIGILTLAIFTATGLGPLLAQQTTKIDVKKLPPAAPGAVDFRSDIKPIFAKSCVSCHGPMKQRGGLRLDDADAALKGGNSGPVIVPAKALASRLLHVVAGLDPEVTMPPKEKPPLTVQEIAKLRAWIEQGAKWPREAAGVSNKSDHWSFQPVKKPAVPKVQRQGWTRNPVDAFILARLEKDRIEPAPEADRATLLRRLSLDLLGLPPEPRDVDDFLQDTRADAYERLVDRLLQSPHYGERWGRHWLDLARYADSDGYEADRERFFAWRYRNWVIDAFNRDLPFDQFTIEQLAGDLLPGSTLEQKTATGFHRNTLTNKEGGTDKEQFRVEACVDRVNTTAKVWLGITFGCAQCHDHKYDPFSQREYYQLFAFFNSDNEVDVPAPLAGEEPIFRKKKAAFDEKKAELKVALETYKQAEQPKKTDKKLAALTKALADHEKTLPTLSELPTLAVGKFRKTHIMMRGDFLRPGIEVQPGTPAVLPSFHADKSPTRLDLARWLVSADNPLTARVISNWVWHHYFGRGLVATLEDFGTQGEKPSHADLLDYLATELKSPSPFAPQGRGAGGEGKPWSLKAFHKLIVTSATYRQSSKARPELLARDPYNTLLARQNRLRLEAEIIRDNALAASGLLVRTIGGPSVKPPQPAGISELTYASRAKWVESKGQDRLRRGMYTWFQRTSPYPMLMTFDAPDGNLCCVRRDKSNTPLQALTLLNDTAFVECAQALARRIQTTNLTSPAERIAFAYRLCLAREPSPRELAIMTQLHDDLLAACRASPQEAVRLAGAIQPPGSDSAQAAVWVALSRTLLNLDEFVSRE